VGDRDKWNLDREMDRRKESVKIEKEEKTWAAVRVSERERDRKGMRERERGLIEGLNNTAT